MLTDLPPFTQDRSIGGAFLYEQFRDYLVNCAANGLLRPSLGPGERVVASHFTVSVGTVRLAVKALIKADMLKVAAGRGTFVREHSLSVNGLAPVARRRGQAIR